MNEVFDGTIDECCRLLKLDFSSAELARLALENGFSQEALNDMTLLFKYLRDKKEQTTIETLLRMSRLPQKAPKTFEGFDFSVLRGKGQTDLEKLQNIRTLAPIYAHRNLAFIGPPGTGKTHLAHAFGHECCKHGLKTYFIKASELRDKFTNARRTEKTATAVTNLVRPSCLIIDKIGRCDFDEENTRLFFDMVDRRYNKEGAYNIVFTSNRDPSLWRQNFHEEDTLLCALDRIFDDAAVFNFMGESFRGKRLETFALQTGRVPGTSI